MSDFWEFYSWIEAAVKLNPDEFIKNEPLRKKAIEGIKGLVIIIVEEGEKLVGKTASAKDLPVLLASARVIKGSTADELAELFDLAQKADELDAYLLYSNLVRFMEVFEEVYFSIVENYREKQPPEKR
ncbi:MAG: hypothetical protein RXP28_05110 [Nitrososphaeria archaeon]